MKIYLLSGFVALALSLATATYAADTEAIFLPKNPDLFATDIYEQQYWGYWERWEDDVLADSRGEKEYLVEASDCIETSGTKDESGVSMTEGQQAVYGFYLPYSSRSVKIVYSGVGSVILKTDENTYNSVELTADSTEYTLEFGANLGRDTAKQYRFYDSQYHGAFLREYVEHSGEKEVEIEATQGNVVIKQLLFEKELTVGPKNPIVPKSFSAEDGNTAETISTVFMDKDAPIIIVNGGRRYIDNNNTGYRPYNFNGSLYLPIETLANALGYYYEDIVEYGYALMRSDTHEVVLVNGKCTVTEGLALPNTAPKNVFIYHNGRTLAAVRYFAELTGKTVGYKDGLVVIDDKYTVSDILNTESLRGFATEKFAEFKEVDVSSTKTYYVSVDGKYDNLGTKESPYNLAKATETATAGDTVILGAGVYRETLMPQNDGTPTAPITYKAEEGQKVTFSANNVLGKPIMDADYISGKNVYSVPMPETLGVGRDQIFINNEMQTEARYPDGPGHLTDGRLSSAWGVRGDIFKAPGTTDNVDYTTFVSDTLLDNPSGHWTGGVYVGQFGQSYALISGKIVGSEKGKITISDTEREQRRWWNAWSENCAASIQNAWNYGMIVGHKNAMSVDGEWVRDVDDEGNYNLYIILPDSIDGVPATEINIEAKARQRVIDLSDRKFINIEGIETIGGGITMNNSEMCMLNGLEMNYISHYTLASDAHSGYIEFPFDNTESGSQTPQKGEVGVYLSGCDNIVVNSKINHSAGAGIYLTGLYSYIENNIINDCGYMGSYASGIHIDTVPWQYKYSLRGGYFIHNNTVFNTGRGAIDFNKNGNNQEDALFLPCDIGYNDFHDACLTALDAGVIYANGVTAGLDKKMTAVHHNYVYKTTSGEDKNYFERAIYWDGNAHGFDTFSNIIFNTGDEPFMDRYVSQQGEKGAEAGERLWNNQSIGYIEVPDGESVAESLKSEYFSESRPFFAGAYLGLKSELYLKNYHSFAESDDCIYTALEAIPGDEVLVSEEDGYASFTDEGQYLLFENVDFGECADEIVISYRCDSNWTYDKIDILVGEHGGGIEAAHKYETMLEAQDPPGFNQVCTHRVAVLPTSGEKDVWIRIAEYYSVQIGAIAVYDRAEEFKNDNFAQFEYMINYTDGNNSDETFMVNDPALNYGNPVSPGVKSTWSGKTVRFAKQTITEDATHFVMAAGSREQNRKQLVKVYLCSPSASFSLPTGAPDVEFTILNKNFYDMTPIMIPVGEKIPAGTYDIYVKFEGYAGSSSKTSNIHYFGFLKEGHTATYDTQMRQSGGMYSSITYEEGTEIPLSAVMLSRDDAKLKKLIYTLPGTIAAYEDVDAISDCGNIVVNYSAVASHANQEIKITVKNSDGDVVAEGEFTTEGTNGIFVNKTVALTNTVSNGTYTVSFEFGGQSNEDKTCQLAWFSFKE